MAESIAELLVVQQQAAALGAIVNDVIAARLGIGATDLKCLLLVLREPRTPRELATELRLPPSTITSVLDRLVNAGFVHRAPSPSDRRRVVISSVPERTAEAIAYYQPLHAGMANLLAGYDDTQLATLRDFAERSVDLLRARLAVVSGSEKMPPK
ncbi:MAG TPA: MarR family transcriptional regulator [Pseudonocardiaceae bacterium]|jgi:DNA-binding MarR family transcriptional regulator|nr:MarR family transcriptional regulator [Pseudonocardiaceae bacterium]